MKKIIKTENVKVYCESPYKNVSDIMKSKYIDCTNNRLYSIRRKIICQCLKGNRDDKLNNSRSKE